MQLSKQKLRQRRKKGLYIFFYIFHTVNRERLFIRERVPTVRQLTEVKRREPLNPWLFYYDHLLYCEENMATMMIDPK